ncbi:MAG: hypothetical protein JXR75_10275 [Rhodobacteraceae bacterium]|nr:hypothetical protein [Paracoccaceae bacterium]
MKIVTMMWAATFPALAFGQSFPASYAVKGVSANDVLNIRKDPSATAQSEGHIGPFAMNVEVLETTPDGKWGRVGIPEGNGWVAMAFLELTLPDDPLMIPRPFSCFGTEPFWSVSLYAGGAEYHSPETGAVMLTLGHEAVAPEGFLFSLEEGPTRSRTMIVTRESCSDGMSDRAFGFATRMFIEAPDGNAAFQGCCTLDHR